MTDEPDTAADTTLVLPPAPQLVPGFWAVERGVVNLPTGTELRAPSSIDNFYALIEDETADTGIVPWHWLGSGAEGVQGLQLNGLALYPGDAVYKVCVAPDSPIEGVEDLAGRTIAAPRITSRKESCRPPGRESCRAVMTDMALHDAGVTDASVVQIPAMQRSREPDELHDVLAQDDIDAAICMQGHNSVRTLFRPLERIRETYGARLGHVPWFTTPGTDVEHSTAVAEAFEDALHAGYQDLDAVTTWTDRAIPHQVWTAFADMRLLDITGDSTAVLQAFLDFSEQQGYMGGAVDVDALLAVQQEQGSTAASAPS